MTINWLRDLPEQVPVGDLPASDLIPGDLIDLGHGYPVQLLQVIPRSRTMRLIYGPDECDQVIISATTVIRVTGWFDDRAHV